MLMDRADRVGDVLGVQHAAVAQIRDGISGQQAALATLMCNFPRGSDLMEHSQVVTFLHEFGHLIHYLFAGGHHWSGVSGISTEWDFVEAPSQMLQEWVWDYDTIAQFAKNVEGEVMPRALLDRMMENGKQARYGDRENE